MLLIADILISNSFNHYVNLDIMLSLGISALKVYNNRQNATQATDKKEDVPNGRKASDR